MNPIARQGTRNLISNIDAGILRDAYGYTINLPSTRQTFLATYDAGTGTLRISSDPGVASTTIELDYSFEDLFGLHVYYPTIFVSVNTIRSAWRNPTKVEVVTGNGHDYINVDDTAPGLPTSISGDGRDDVVTIGKGGSVAGIAGPVSVSNESTLIIDAANDPWPQSATISKSSITGLVTVDYDYSRLSRLIIYGGSGGNTFTVTGTPNGLTSFVAEAPTRSTCRVRTGSSTSTAGSWQQRYGQRRRQRQRARYSGHAEHREFVGPQHHHRRRLGRRHRRV